MAGENEDIAFTLERWFAAPRDLVWKVYTEAEHLAHWWGPSNFTSVKGTMDLKPGGMFHYGMRGPGGQIMWGKFVYREIAAPERLVFVNSFSDEHGGTTPNPWNADWVLETLNIVTFTEENGRTLISMRGVPVNATEAQRQMFKDAKAQMQAGFKGTLDKLDAYLAQQQAKQETIMQVNTHLSFDGHCEEAFKFYEKALGGKIEMISTYGTSPMAGDMPAGWDKKVIHGRVNIGGTIVMGADAPPGRYSRPQGATLTLSTDNSADADRFFSALSEKGAVSMPMAETFFAHRFGMVTDQFGIPWMVIHQKTP